MDTKYDYQIDMSVKTSHTLILQQVSKGSRVLEFGPATGYMTRYMKNELGCQITCIEVDKAAADIARQYCDQMIVADLDDLKWGSELSGQRFDHLVFADVLEHLKDPWKVLKFAVQFLKESGSAILSVPNIGHNAVIMDLLQGKFEYRSVGLMDDTHIRFFTRQSIVQLLEKADLCPVQWLATYARPESTEFNQNYNEFPQEFRSFLENKQDAHVYQFITVSKRKDAVTPDECSYELVPDANEASSGNLQVYWEGNEGFCEAQSVRAPYVLSEGTLNCDLEIPPGIHGRLRLDPLEYPAHIEITNLKLYEKLCETSQTGLGRVLGSWTSATELVGVRPLSGLLALKHRGTKEFVSTNNDPQLLLETMPDLASNTSKILRVQLKISSDVYEPLGNEIEDALNQLSELCTLTDQQAEELETLRIQISAMNRQLGKITRSRVWPLANLILRIGRFGARARNYIFGRIAAIKQGGFVQELIPFTNIQQVTGEQFGNWEATDNDPQFLLKGPWSKGWSEISWDAAADYPLRMRLYLDRGRGFNELESIDLGVFNCNDITHYKVIVPVGFDLKGVRLDPGEVRGRFVLKNFKMLGVTRIGIFLRAINSSLREKGTFGQMLGEIGSSIAEKGIKGPWVWAKKLMLPSDNYDIWMRYTKLSEGKKETIQQRIEQLDYKPTFSIVVPVYNVEERWLRKCIDSVKAQIYPYWELCIADDASPDPRVKQVLDEYAADDSRIKVIYREKNGHISAASNSALELATGEYIALLDNDDELTPDALYENAMVLNQQPETDMIYSDEDKIDELGERFAPFFKPDWSPDTFLSQMYTCHFGVYRAEIIREIGGFRIGLEGSQDYDLVLRFTERTRNIYHIPKILYHWRTIAESTAANPNSKKYAFVAGAKAIQEALDRRGDGGSVEQVENYPGQYRVHYPVKGNPLISIIIPTRDMPKILDTCLKSVFEKTLYSNYEVIVIDNGSVQPQTFKIFNKWQQKEPIRFRTLRLDIPFNYSRLNNEAVKTAKGELIVLLNNDIEVVSPNWLEEMAGQAQRPSIGAVGSLLLYPDDTVQHAGVILGIGGIASHSHKGVDKKSPGYFGRLLIVANCAAVTGACLMVKRILYEKVGGLDEQLKVAYNDIDFCLKITQAGYLNVFIPQVRLYHHESKSRGFEDTVEKLERFHGEVNIFKTRWGTLINNDPYYNPNLTLEREDFSVAVPPRI
jgi:O-antigen biosynthesis protein